MAIELNFEHSDPIVLTDLRGIDSHEELGLLFAGECYLNGTFIETLQSDDDSERIVSAKWVDENPETDFHTYVLAYMNNTDINQIVNVAEGTPDTHKYMEAISNHLHGFEEAVDDLVKSDGLEFIFGNGFCLTTLFDLVVREIVRDYLRKHEIATYNNATQTVCYRAVQLRPCVLYLIVRYKCGQTSKTIRIH